ncbi:hypothetical protein BCR39DRAFT_555385 [Naematelia encephala]|uniref:SMP-30/Gluconolactonase/LRE-like region domain-containing protein n=1 Tax=Naematelia encephala TaxID=71784 RepID=A0A1Y2ACN9_9TREE|nr:hypothetical protein BCR39DRAFT_555385 [Naematelia encephala]
MSQAPVIDAEVFIECQNDLGEGILWDSKTQLLHWVDIPKCELHTLDPKTKKYSVDSYPATKHLTAVALRQSQPGLVASITDKIVLLPAPTTPTEVTTSPKPVQREWEQVLASNISAVLDEGKGRLNDGGCDTQGRFLVGSMGLPESGPKVGEFFSYDLDSKVTRLWDRVGTSNGLGWTADGKTMYYIDSLIDAIHILDYDPTTGEASSRREFAPPSPPPMPLSPSIPTQGVYDGMCLDGQGNVWAARWSDQRIIGFRPDGSIICHIRVPGCYSPTIPCFGGENLETMYIATAHSKMSGKDLHDKFPKSGDLFKVDFGSGSEVRQLLGDGWTGAERHRFAG